jgi:hypothetical protein
VHNRLLPVPYIFIVHRHLLVSFYCDIYSEQLKRDHLQRKETKAILHDMCVVEETRDTKNRWKQHLLKSERKLIDTD